MSRAAHYCERCCCSELYEHRELIPLRMPRLSSEQFFAQRLVQVCKHCGHKHVSPAGKVCLRRNAPPGARIVWPNTLRGASSRPLIFPQSTEQA